MPRMIVSVLLLACASAPPGPFADPLTTSYAPALGVDLQSATRLDNGLYIQDVRPGEGAAAVSRSQVRLHYTLFLPDGRQVQTSRGNEPLTTRLDDPALLIRAAVVGMRPGGRRIIVVPPARGYGREGLPGMVPPNSTIVFDVELLSISS